MKILNDSFNAIIDPTNIWQSWLDYRRGKSHRLAVIEFGCELEKKLWEIKSQLENLTYQHGRYEQFIVFDPKKRIISTPSVKNHIVHRLIYNILYPFYDKLFLSCSFSCRKNKGQLRAIITLARYIRQITRNSRKPCWVLHGDIKKCFDSIDHKILLNLLRQRIKCVKTLQIVKEIIFSYNPGIPLGNLTSQLFVNIYLHELDRFVKEKLKIKRYLRYADDFIVLFDNQNQATKTADTIRSFLGQILNLEFPLTHQKIRKISQGFEVLGVKFFSDYFYCRPKSFLRARKLFSQRINQYHRENISLFSLNSTWQSICGLLKYGHNYAYKKELSTYILGAYYV